MLDAMVAGTGGLFGLSLAAFAFLAGGIVNATGHPRIRASFIELGFPGWWCRVTAGLEVATSMLLLLPASRPIGIALGGCVMIAAIAAILAHKLYRHLPPPLLFLFLLTWAGLGHPA